MNGQHPLVMIIMFNISEPVGWKCDEEEDSGNKNGLGPILLVVGCVVGAIVTGITVAWAILHTWPSLTQMFTSATHYSPGGLEWVSSGYSFQGWQVLYLVRCFMLGKLSRPVCLQGRTQLTRQHNSRVVISGIDK